MKADTKTQAVGRAEAVDSSVSPPLIHKFKTSSCSYVFDVNSGEIVRVDDVVWEIIDDSYQNMETVLARHKGRFTADQIRTAYQEIQQARADDGYFVHDHPKVAMQVDRARLEHLLDHSRLSLTLNVTERCNFRCTYCPFTYNHDGTRRHSSRNMSWETAKAAIDDFLEHCVSSHTDTGPGLFHIPPVNPSETFKRKRLGPPAHPPAHISFYGGEPLLNFSLIKRCTEYALANANGKNITFGMTTNGYLLQGDMADFLGVNKFRIRVSLDGPQAVHDSQRTTVDGSPTWAVVVDNVRAFGAKYPESLPSLGATLGPAVDLREAIEYLATADWIAPFQDVSAALAEEPYPGYNQAVAGPSPFADSDALYQTYLKDLLKGRLNVVVDDRGLDMQRARYAERFFSLHTKRWQCAVSRRNPGSLAPSGPCVPGALRTFVSVTGAYQLCEKSVPCEAYQFGDAFSGIDKEKSYAILQEFIECTRERCEQCWCLPMCMVGCYVSVDRVFGRGDKVTRAIKEQACNDCRAELHERLIEYCSILERNPKAFDYLKLYYA